jgi:hypothetical protein
VINAEQGAGLGVLWGSIGELFAALPGGDVIADCGRIGADGPQYDLLAQAAAVLLVTRPNPGDVIRLRDRAAAVTAGMSSRGRRGFPPSVLVIADQRTLRATAGEIGQALAQGNVPAPVLGGLADDPKGAELLRGEWGGRLDKTLLIRTAREIAQQLVSARPDDAGAGPPGTGGPGPGYPQEQPPPPGQPAYPPGEQYPPQPQPHGQHYQPGPAAPPYPAPAPHQSPPSAQSNPAQPYPPGQPPQSPGTQSLGPPPPPGPPRAPGRHSASAQPGGTGDEAGEGRWITA